MSKRFDNLWIMGKRCFAGLSLRYISGGKPISQWCPNAREQCAKFANRFNIYMSLYGPLARYAQLRVRMRRECRERFPLKSAAGENVPGIPGACATCNFTYLVRGPLQRGPILIVSYIFAIFSSSWLPNLVDMAIQVYAVSESMSAYQLSQFYPIWMLEVWIYRLSFWIYSRKPKTVLCIICRYWYCSCVLKFFSWTIKTHSWCIFIPWLLKTWRHKDQFYSYGLTFILAWINKYTHYKM